MWKKLLMIGLSMVLSVSLMARTFAEDVVKEPRVEALAPLHETTPRTPSTKGFLDCPFPIVDAYNLSEHTYGLVGVEVMGDVMWTTAFELYGDNYVFIVDMTTHEVIDSFVQPTTSTYGWRDMAYDGQYVYASDGDSISVIDPNTYEVVNTLFPEDNDLSVYRALAYDGDSIVATNWNTDDNVWKFATDGSGARAITTGGVGGTYGAYGLAWDPVLNGFWLSGQSPNSASIVWLPYDAANGVIDEANINAFPAVFSDDFAGGCDLDDDYLYYVDQSADMVFVYRVHPAAIDLGVAYLDGVPPYVVVGESVAPVIYVKNFGLTPVTSATVTVTILDENSNTVYQETYPVSTLNPQEIDTIEANPWVAEPVGNYTVIAQVSCVNDGEQRDDVWMQSFSVVNIHSGGPDGYGYTFVDSDDPSGAVDFEWIDATALGTQLSYVSFGDDRWETVDLPFSFPFYNMHIESLWVCSNGFLSTDFFYGSYSNTPLPIDMANGFIGGFWTDLSPQNGNGIWYYEDPNGQFVVFQWDQVPLYGGGGPYTFEIILYANGDIKMQYLSVEPPLDDFTIGIQGDYGNNDFYLQYACDGEPTAPHDSLAIYFQRPLVPDFATDFEADEGGFSTVTGGWEWGTPTIGPDAAHSGVNVWGTVLDDYYSSNAYYELLSPLMVANTDNPYFTFYHWYSIEDGWDGGNVQISTDGGATWTVIEPDDGYPDSYVSVLDGPGYTGESGGWVQATFHLDGITAGTNFYLRFLFASDGSVNYPGWYIDDFAAYGFAPVAIEHDIEAVSIDSLPDMGVPGIELPLYATFVNNGVGAETFDVYYEIYGSEKELLHQVVQTVTDLPPGEEITVDFGTWTAGEDVYTIVAYSALVGDQIPENDTVSTEFPTIGHTGGPDSYGYCFVDNFMPSGPTFDWIEPVDSVWLTAKTLGELKKKPDKADVKGDGTKSWDDGYFAVPLPFTFTFYGVPHDTAYVSTNGYISFSGNDYTDISNDPIPSTITPNDLIAVLWDDLKFYESDSARLDTISGVTSEGVRYFVIEWDHVSRFGHEGDPMEFEAILYENGEIVLQYKHVFSYVTMTIGIENPDGTDGLQYIYDNDPFAPPDSLAIKFYHVELPGYFTDFEADDGGFTVLTEGWEWGTPTVGPDAAHSGVNVWGTVLDDTYSNYADYELITPMMEATSDAPHFAFWHWYSIEEGWDGGNVQISTDGGATWTVIEPDGGYPDSYVHALDGPGYTGESGGWVRATFHLDDITAGTRFYIKFYFASDGSVSYPGWYIDDFASYGFAPVAIEHDIEAVSIDSLPLEGVPNIELPLYATFVNNGIQAETFTAFYEIYNSNGELVHQVDATVTDLQPGESRSVNFGTWTSGLDIYTLVAYSTLAGDEIPGNDTVMVEFSTVGHTGGPDAFSYAFVDNAVPGGPVFDWIEATDSVWLTAKASLAKMKVKSFDKEKAAVAGGEKGWDDGYFAIPLPFSFSFYGNLYDTVYASTNGYLCFSGEDYDDYSNDPIPYQWSPNDLIAVFWDDLKFRDGSHLDTISGVTPEGVRYFVIEYDSVSFYAYPEQFITFEAILYEDGSIVLQYLDLGTNDITHGASATVGIENQDGTIGLQYLYDGEPFLLIEERAIKFFRLNDAAVAEIIEPSETGYPLNQAVPLIAVVRATPSEEVSLEAKVISEEVVLFDSVVTFTATGTDTVDFGTYIPPHCGIYQVLFTVSMEGDVNPDNDEMSTSFGVYRFTYPDNLPVFETTAGWEFGEPEGGAYAGTNAWATGLTTNYEPNADWTLVTPSYPLYGEHPVFVFHHRFEFSDEDAGIVEMSMDDGATWVKVEPVIGGYNGTSPLFGDEAAYVGTSDWMTSFIDLSDYVGAGDNVIFRFHFRSNDSGEAFGWVIDDYGVSYGGFELPNDAGVVTASVVPGAVLAGATTHHLTADVFNSSLSSAGNFIVVAKIFGPDGMLYYRSQKTVYLEPGEVVTVYFQPDFVPMMVGDYRLEVIVASSLNDPVLENNTYTADFTVAITKALADNEVGRTVPLKFDVKLYPNPAVASATIDLALPHSASVDIKIYDASGRVVRTLANRKHLDAGYYTFSWDGTDGFGRKVSAGVYFLEVHTDAGDHMTSRLVLLK